MKCVVIDDEPFALELISGYIRKTPYLELVNEFTNPFKAIDFLLKTHVDLVFLDINMPEISGIELLKSLPDLPQVIFTTAYSEYGAESYDYNAIDYLLKPVKYDRFLKAVNKAIGSTTNKNREQTAPATEQAQESILIKSGTQLLRLATDDILYIESDGNYVTIFTRNGKVMSLYSMNEILGVLPPELFVRVHKSYIISLKQVDVIEKARVIINKTSIPIGITYREHFSKLVTSGGSMKLKK